MTYRLRSKFWFVPAVCVVGAVVLGVALVAADRAFGATRVRFLFPGPASGARSYLSSIISAMISFTGLVFSITVVVLQLSSGQFSPRVLRTFLRDRTIQFALGGFMATFVYALVVLRTVGGDGNDAIFVPRVSVTVAFGFVLLSVALFIRYIDHVANLVRVATIIQVIGTEARSLLESRFPPDQSVGQEPSVLTQGGRAVSAARSGVVVSVDESALVRLAARQDCLIVLAWRIGDYVPAGMPLAHLRRPGGRREAPAVQQAHEVLGEEQMDAAVCAAIHLDIERTTEQDLAFGFRQLVDIAERALSPGINDPTTATQTLDEMHDLLRRLATRHLPTGEHRDDRALLRLVVPQYAFEDYLDLVVGEVWRYGSDAAQVPERLQRLLRDLSDVALPEHHAALQQWAEVLSR